MSIRFPDSRRRVGPDSDSDNDDNRPIMSKAKDRMREMAMLDLGSASRERQTAHDVGIGRLVNPEQLDRVRRLNLAGTEEAENAVRNEKSLEAWNSLPRDVAGVQLEAFAAGQTHRAAMTRTIESERQHFGALGLNLTAENIDTLRNGRGVPNRMKFDHQSGSGTRKPSAKLFAQATHTSCGNKSRLDPARDESIFNTVMRQQPLDLSKGYSNPDATDVAQSILTSSSSNRGSTRGGKAIFPGDHTQSIASNRKAKSNRCSKRLMDRSTRENLSNGSSPLRSKWTALDTTSAFLENLSSTPRNISDTTVGKGTSSTKTRINAPTFEETSFVSDRGGRKPSIHQTPASPKDDYTDGRLSPVEFMDSDLMDAAIDEISTSVIEPESVHSATVRIEGNSVIMTLPNSYSSAKELTNDQVVEFLQSYLAQQRLFKEVSRSASPSLTATREIGSVSNSVQQSGLGVHKQESPRLDKIATPSSSGKKKSLTESKWATLSNCTPTGFVNSTQSIGNCPHDKKPYLSRQNGHSTPETVDTSSRLTELNCNLVNKHKSQFGGKSTDSQERSGDAEWHHQRNASWRGGPVPAGLAWLSRDLAEKGFQLNTGVAPSDLSLLARANTPLSPVNPVSGTGLTFKGSGRAIRHGLSDEDDEEL